MIYVLLDVDFLEQQLQNNLMDIHKLDAWSFERLVPYFFRNDINTNNLNIE